jgi:cytochrome c553
MTKRPLAIATACALLLGLAACGKSEPAAEGAAHKPAQQRVSAYDGDIARGEKLAATKLPSGQSCVDCHGAGGVKPIDAATPVIGSQYQDYLFHSLQQYRDGKRDHALMTMQIKGAFDAGTLDNQGLADLSAYFAKQDGPLGDLHGK